MSKREKMPEVDLTTITNQEVIEALEEVRGTYQNVLYLPQRRLMLALYKANLNKRERDITFTDKDEAIRYMVDIAKAMSEDEVEALSTFLTSMERKVDKLCELATGRPAPHSTADVLIRILPFKMGEGLLFQERVGPKKDLLDILNALPNGTLDILYGADNCVLEPLFRGIGRCIKEFTEWFERLELPAMTNLTRELQATYDRVKGEVRFIRQDEIDEDVGGEE